MDIEDFIETIKTKKDFCHFVELLAKDLEENSAEWENPDLASFLRAIVRYTHSLENNYIHRRIEEDAETPSWRRFADILMGATVYE